MRKKITSLPPVVTLLVGVLLIKLVLILIAGLSFDFEKHPRENWMSIWNRWDAKAYETIATQGYTAPQAAPDYRAFLSHFPPLYPVIVGLVPALSFPAAGMVVSLVSILAASYFLYKIVRLDHDTTTAVWAVAFLNLYPTSYFTVAPYAESVFLLLVIGSFWWLRAHPRSAWVAGLGIGASILTRLMGIVTAPALVWYAWPRPWRGRQHRHLTVSDVFLLFIPLWALVMYLALNKLYFGHPLFFLQEYRLNIYSHKALVYPFKYTVNVIGQGAARLQSGQGLDYDYFMQHGWNALFTIVSAGLIIVGLIKRIPILYSLYAITALLFFNVFDWGISNARYTLSIWPIFLVLALLPRPAKYTAAIISAVLLVYFTRIFTSGAWAF